MIGCQACAILTLILCLIIAFIMFKTRDKWMPAYDWVGEKYDYVKGLVGGNK